MNRTIEQWQEVVGSGQHTSVLDQAIEDMQELARQRDELQTILYAERAAWSAKRMELLRNNDLELARRKSAEKRCDDFAYALDIIVSLENDFASGVAERAISVLKSINEQTK